MPAKHCYNCMTELSGTAKVCPKCGFDNSHPGQPPQALPCGTVLHDRYLIGKMLGQGGFGITYIGYDYTLKATVCIKEFFPVGGAMRSYDGKSTVHWSSDNTGVMLKRNRESFVREAQKAAKVRNLVSVVNVWDVFYENDTAYIVMEYIHGKTVKEYLMKRGTVMDIRECLSVFRPVMRDLQGVHEAGIVHRDISPDNLMIREDGKVKLLDLGAAKDLTGGTGQSSTIVQKRGFSPPEQYMEKGELGSWTDVYAMCATIYWCMTGKVVPEALERLMGDTLRFPETIPERVADVLERGLELKPENRIRDFGALMTELEQAAQGSDDAGIQTVPKTEKNKKSDAENPKELKTERVTERGTGRSVKPLPVALLAAIVVICIVFFMSRRGTNDLTNDLANDVKGETGSTEEAVLSDEDDSVTGGSGESAAAEGLVSEEDGKGEAQEEDTGNESSEEAATAEAMSAEKPVSPPGTLSREKFKKWADYSDVEEIIIINSLEEAPAEVRDLSEEEDESVIGWMDGEKLYLAGEGGIRAPEDSSFLFTDQDYLRGRSQAHLSRVTKITGTEYFDMSQVTSAKGLFRYCESLRSIDVSNWDMSNVTDVSYMFYGCEALRELELGAWDTSSVTDASYLFYGCSRIENLYVNQWDTSNITSMTGMFGECRSIKNLDVSGWDTSNVTEMDKLFLQCNRLEALDAGSWDTSNVTTMEEMFCDCRGLKELNVDGWDTSSLTNTTNMFEGTRWEDDPPF